MVVGCMTVNLNRKFTPALDGPSLAVVLATRGGCVSWGCEDVGTAMMLALQLVGSLCDLLRLHTLATLLPALVHLCCNPPACHMQGACV
jgi:hypothetical protein